MKHWEFLIQKEGDRSWLPLDSPDVEILEGRYRMVVRSHWPNTDVQVRISHLVTEETPPRRRLQKRTSRTNPDGLMVVIPFTTLEPGIWEFQCLSGDLMSDLLSSPGQSSVQLHVSPRAVEEEPWEPDWQAPDAELAAPPLVNGAGEAAVAEAAPPSIAPEIPPLASVPAVPLEAVEPPAAFTLADTSEFAESEAPALESPSLAPTPEPFSSPVIPLNAADVAELGPIPWFPVQEPAAAVEPALEPLAETAASSQDSFPDLEINPILSASREELIHLTEQLSEQILAEVLQDFDFLEDPGEAVEALAARSGAAALEMPVPISDPTRDLIGDLGSDFVSHPTIDPETTLLLEQALRNCNYTLTLDQEAFIASRGEEVTLSGQVDLDALADAEEGSVNDRWQAQAQLSAIGFAVQELQLCLRDPQSSHILVSDRQACIGYLPPFSFSVTFTLPLETSTRLVLGEVMLCGSLTAANASPLVLANQAFTVTVDPKALVSELTRLNEMLTEEPEEVPIESPAQLSHRIAREETSPSLELSFLKPTEEAAAPKPAGITFLAGQPLPPQLYHPDPDQPRTRSLDLPKFPSSETIVPAPEEIVEEQPALVEAADPSSTQAAYVEEAEAAEAAAEASLEPSLEQSRAIMRTQDPAEEGEESLETAVAELAPAEPAAEALANSAASEAIEETEETEETASRNPLASIQMAFQSLRLQDRFLSRLSSFASTSQAERSPESSLATVPTSTAHTPLTPDSELLAHEIVVDDEPISPRDRRRASGQPTAREVEPTFRNPLMLPEDQPVPIPELHITAGDLVAGRLVNVRVRLPDLLPRIYVKLWLNDRQTRSLLDGPRWLVDFAPNGRGALEAHTQVIVPFGSLEVRFEAIAVEMHTQRESHKAVVDRGVIPPDLPALSLDDDVMR